MELVNPYSLYIVIGEKNLKVVQALSYNAYLFIF